MMSKITLEQLVEIATEVEAGDPADWGKLAVGQEQAFRMIGTSILDMFDKEVYTDDDKLIMLATITKLTVENMLLNLKIMDKIHK
jgi:hypothetical protein